MLVRVFSDSAEQFHVEISHPAVAHAARLSVPRFAEDEPILRELNPAFLVPVRFNDRSFQVAFASISTQALWKDGAKEIGFLEEGVSRNILNNLGDILGY